MLVTHLCVGVIIIPILEGVREHTIYINTIYIKAFQRNLEGFFLFKNKNRKTNCNEKFKTTSSSFLLSSGKLFYVDVLVYAKT